MWGGAQTAKTARAKKALGSAAAQVKPLSASKDFHDELSSVRAVAGKLLDGEGTQTQTLAQKAPSDILQPVRDVLRDRNITYYQTSHLPSNLPRWRR